MPQQIVCDDDLLQIAVVVGCLFRHRGLHVHSVAERSFRISFARSVCYTLAAFPKADKASMASVAQLGPARAAGVIEKECELVVHPSPSYGERSSAWLEHLVVVQRVAGSSPVARPRSPLVISPMLRGRLGSQFPIIRKASTCQLSIARLYD